MSENELTFHNCVSEMQKITFFPNFRLVFWISKLVFVYPISSSFFSILLVFSFSVLPLISTSSALYYHIVVSKDSGFRLTRKNTLEVDVWSVTVSTVLSICSLVSRLNHLKTSTSLFCSLQSIPMLKYRRALRFVILFLGLVLLVMFLHFLIDLIRLEVPFLAVISFHFLILQRIIVESLFVYSVLVVRDNLVSMKNRIQGMHKRYYPETYKNRIFSQFFTITRTTLQRRSPPNELFLFITKLQHQHGMLCDIVANINTVYGFQLLTHTVDILFFALGASYFTVVALIDGFGEDDIEIDFLESFLMTWGHLFRILAVTWAASETYAQVSETFVLSCHF